MPSESFLFNPRASNDNPYIKEKRKALEDMQEVISDLRQRVMVNNQPLFDTLIRYCFNGADSADIVTLGKAITKYGKLLPELTELEEQIKAVDLVKANPALMELAFADSSGIPGEFEELLKNADV